MTSIHSSQERQQYKAPTQSTFDPSLTPQSNQIHTTVPIVGTREEVPPHEGAGSAIYIAKPTRSQLKDASATFGSAKRPFYYKDPEGKEFIDVDGISHGTRWIRVDLRDGEGGKFCSIM